MAIFSNKLKKILFFFFLISNPIFLQAKTGDVFLQNYEIPIPNLDNHNLAAVQGLNDWMFFANTKGVLVYDGVRWELIETFTTPNALVYDKENQVVFVGCRDNFGYIYQDRKGRLIYHSIPREGKADFVVMGLEVRLASIKDFATTTGRSFGQITRILMSPKYVYFYSDKEFFRITRKTRRFSKSWTLENFEDRFSGIFLHKNILFLNVANEGLHFIDRNENLTFFEGGERFQYLYIRTSLQYDSEQSLLGADNSWNYLFDGNKFTLFFFVEEDFLKASQLSFSINIDNETFATATLTGGVIILEKKTGKTKEIINYQTGLPDDEILALTRDKLGGLWICHEQGITRADLQIPIKTFSSYAGLDGFVTNVEKIGDSLFVGTSKGLFFLSKVESFDEVEGYIKKEAKRFQQVKTITKVVRITEPTDKQNFRTYNRNEQRTKDRTTERRRIKTKEKSENSKEQLVSIQESRPTFTTSEKRKAYALASIPYIFKRVEGTDAKVHQLLTVENHLLTATNAGLYVVSNQEGQVPTAQMLIEDVDINFLLPHPNSKNKVVYVGTSGGLKRVVFGGGVWKEVESLENFEDETYSILFFDDNLWVGAENRVVRIKLDSTGAFQDYQDKLKYFSYPFEESYSEKVPVRLVDNKIVVFLSRGIFSYDAKSNAFKKDKKLQKYLNPRATLIYQQEGFTWTNALKNWLNLEAEKKTKTSFTFLEIFKDISNIFVDNSENLWIVNKGDLYEVDTKKADANSLKNYKTAFDVKLRSIQNPKGGYFPLEDSLRVDYGDTTVSFNFQFATSFYQSESGIQYQYWLENAEEKGKDKKDKWSDWDKNATISFPFLPSGKYKLHIRAKNVFGQSIEKKVFTLEIRPPFWETTLFYALQTLFFLTLLILSFIFSRSQRGIVANISYVLSFITIITLFEFLILLIEPYVDDASEGIPVFKLGMNIILAMTLAPAEQLLRRFLRRDKYNKSKEKKAAYGKREGAEGTPQ